MKILYYLFLIVILNVTNLLSSNFINPNDKKLDSIYISEIQDALGNHKVLHAEPLYIDLIRDLGARAGEKEWNFGFGLTDNLTFDKYNGLVEYEFAPIDRLGLEIEIPFSLYTSNIYDTLRTTPNSKIESIKLAAQWTFYVNPNTNTSLALGYINEFELNNFGSKEKTIKGNLFNPFIVSAKRWNDNFHTLIYAGPRIMYEFEQKETHIDYEIHTSFHWMISGTRNFIGLETSKYLIAKNFDLIFRPQMRLGIADDLLVGIVANIPVNKQNERFGSFLRIIWEPGHDEK